MKQILIIATNGFEQSELMKPKQLLEDAGARTTVASLEEGSIKGWDSDDWGESVAVDKTVDDVEVGDYDALMLPGGQINPDILRMNDRVIDLIQQFDKAGKPIAAICHAPWLLIEAGLLKGRGATSYKSIRTDLANAGANVMDKEVVVDGNLITSRNPDDIPAFSNAIIDALKRQSAKFTEAA